MFFNQIPPQGGPAQMPMPSQGPPPGMLPPQGMPPGMPAPPMMPPPGMQPPGMGMPPPPQQGQQGTPGLDILKLLMMMKQKGSGGPMSSGIGSVPPPSLNMPFSLPANGSENDGIYSLITKILGKTGMTP